MSEDHFSETSSTGWFGRIGDSIKGVLIGLLLILVFVPVFLINEGRAVKTRKTLEEGAKSLVTVSAGNVEAANEAKLIYFTGRAEAEGALEDDEFAVGAEALKLRRNVEFYQREEEKNTETKKKLGGGEETVTSYDYAMKWGGRVVDSSKFSHPQGHENPRPALTGKQWTADPVRVGGFTLSSGLVSQINNYSGLAGDAAAELPGTIAGKKVHREGGGYYLGADPASRRSAISASPTRLPCRETSA